MAGTEQRPTPVSSDGKVRLFLSSTRTDLEPFRSVVREVSQRLSIEYEGMENFGADPRPPLEVCRERVERCDLFVGLYAHRYGSVLTNGNGFSITHLEYRWAVERSPQLIVLPFIVDPAQPWRVTDVDVGPERDHLNALKKWLNATHTVRALTTPEQLHDDLLSDLPSFRDHVLVRREDEKRRKAEERQKAERGRRKGRRRPISDVDEADSADHAVDPTTADELAEDEDAGHLAAAAPDAEAGRQPVIDTAHAAGSPPDRFHVATELGPAARPASATETGSPALRRASASPDTSSTTDLPAPVSSQYAATSAAQSLDEGRPRRALQLAELGIGVDPNHRECHFAKGLALIALGDGKQGLDALQLAHEMNEVPDPQIRRAYAHALGRIDPPDCREAYRILPDDAIVRRAFVEQALQHGRDLAQAYEIEPDNVEVRRRLSLQLVTTDSSADDVRFACAIAPSLHDAAPALPVDFSAQRGLVAASPDQQFINCLKMRPNDMRASGSGFDVEQIVDAIPDLRNTCARKHEGELRRLRRKAFVKGEEEGNFGCFVFLAVAAVTVLVLGCAAAIPSDQYWDYLTFWTFLAVFGPALVVAAALGRVVHRAVGPRAVSARRRRRLDAQRSQDQVG